MGFADQSQFSIQAVLRLLDPAITMAGLFGLAYLHHVSLVDHYLWLAVISSLLVVITFSGANVYRPWRSAPVGVEVHYILLSWVVVCGALFAMGYATKTSDLFSRRVLLSWVVVTPALIVGAHLAIRMVLRRIRRHSNSHRTAVLVGGGAVAAKLVRKTENNPWLGVKVEGFFENRLDAARQESPLVPHLGKIEDVAEYVRKHNIHIVYLALPMRAEERIRKVVESLGDTTVSIYMVPDIFTFQLINAQAQDLDGLPMISLRESPFSGLKEWSKRIEDLILGSLILALISPLMILIAIGIRLTSSGPALFKQRRYGLYGEEILIYKFRTMTVLEDGDDIKLAEKNDPRITRFGGFLRRTSLDELPQFLNVLQGRMSIVGPRPHAVAINEQYRHLIKGYMIRHKVRPGITGLAQVRGFRGDMSSFSLVEKRIESDISYIRNWSLLLDLKIIVMTIFVGFRQDSAY